MWPFSKKKEPVYFEDLASCHICGCLLVKNSNTEGRPEVVLRSYVNFPSLREMHEYVTERRFYCNAHMPKEDSQ